MVVPQIMNPGPPERDYKLHNELLFNPPFVSCVLHACLYFLPPLLSVKSSSWFLSHLPFLFSFSFLFSSLTSSINSVYRRGQGELLFCSALKIVNTFRNKSALEHREVTVRCSKNHTSLRYFKSKNIQFAMVNVDRISVWPMIPTLNLNVCLYK